MKQLKNILFIFLSLLNTYKFSKNDKLGDNKALKVVMITGGVGSACYGGWKVHKHFSKKTDGKNPQEESLKLENVNKKSTDEEKPLEKPLDKVTDKIIEKPLDNPVTPPKNINPPVKKTTFLMKIDEGNINSLEKECKEVLHYTSTYNMDNIEDDIINFFKNYGVYQKQQYDIKIQDENSNESLRKKTILSNNPHLNPEEVAKEIIAMNSTPKLPETEKLREQLLIYDKITYLISNKNNSKNPEHDYMYSIKEGQEKPLSLQFPAFLEDVNKHFKNPLKKDDLDKIEKVISNLSRVFTIEDNIIKAYHEYLDTYRTGQGKITDDTEFRLFLNRIYLNLQFK